MKRYGTLIVLVLMIFALALPAWSVAGVCSEENGDKTESVVDGDLNDIVLPAGTSFCVKSAEENSGVLTADGVTTLSGYVTWLNEGGQTPDVSHFVVYRPVTTSTSSTTSSTSSTTSSTTSTTSTTTTTPNQETTTTQPSTTTTMAETTTTGATVQGITASDVVAVSPQVETLPLTGFDPTWLIGAAGLLASSGAYLLRRNPKQKEAS